jgi:quinol monooxygenase YgiN
VDDPGLLLYVADWISREGFVARTLMHRAEESLRPLVADYSVQFFSPLVSDVAEPAGRRVAAVSCLLVKAPPDASAAVLAVLKAAAAPRLSAVRGIVQRTLYQDLDDVDRFLILLTWDSPAALQQALQAIAPETDEWLQPHGVQATRFIGHTALAVPD